MIKKFNVKVNGINYEVEVEEIKENIQNKKESPSLKIEPKKINNTLNQEIKPSVNNNQLASQGENSIKAPMPGTINDIKINKGDKVKKGQVLVILEAMKMENEIMAPFDGIVESININKGSSVNAGDVIVVLK
ncbi:biotin/lipoyl-containing protein [Tepidibacter formicigenes]|jgi:biotin carboxyl carrier protein|uniref:Biotin carboxyl carrier protein n=1 Tax=Tepidibacter formicigenes DSM 15518 TaxID=1123349 RepID=A0A1M6RV96_9FIRM|nr:biotin/lipoyl-containing protein [Tepidibacter formicigenes]SHK36386.1 biotin carboxyl carrier protein [Tepidibacter formicigenes DSM 15518]